MFVVSRICNHVCVCVCVYLCACAFYEVAENLIRADDVKNLHPCRCICAYMYMFIHVCIYIVMQKVLFVFEIP